MIKTLGTFLPLLISLFLPPLLKCHWQPTERKSSHINHLPSNNDPQIGTGATYPEHDPKGVIYVICCPLSTGPSPDLSSEVSSPPSSPFDTEGENADDEYDNRYETEGKSESGYEEANKGEDEDASDKGDEDDDEDEDQDWSEWEGPWR